MSCVVISHHVASLKGIRLFENLDYKHPQLDALAQASL